MKRRLLLSILIAIGLLSATSVLLKLPTSADSPRPSIANSNKRDDTGINLATTNALSDSVLATFSGWVQRYPIDTPPARISHAMAYDSSRGKVILFGGYIANSGRTNDIWEWDGINWTQRFPATLPPARDRHAMSYDSVRGRVVLFGGYNDSIGNLQDTWEWDGINWVQQFPTSSLPLPRFGHVMAYDSKNQVTVLFGGHVVSDYNDTWEWDGSSWAKRMPVTTPPAFEKHAMTYDSEREVIILFGGYDDVGLVDDTWQWDGNNWILRTPLNSPLARAYHKLAYNETRSRVILFGGRMGSLLEVGDTWEWDGDNWVRCRICGLSPLARILHAMAYDSEQGTVVLFGGSNSDTGILNDTWEYRSVDLRVTPITRTIAQTDITTYTINVSGTPSSVTLATYFLPQGISGRFIAAQVITPPSQATLVLTSSSTVVDGDYSIGIAGYISGCQSFLYVDLLIRTQDFGLIPSSYQWQTYPGTDIFQSLTIIATPAFTEPVIVEHSNLPQGIEIAFPTNPITPNSTVDDEVACLYSSRDWSA